MLKSAVIFGSLCLLASLAPAQTASFKYAFGTSTPGYTQVAPDTIYSANTGFGFEPNIHLPAPGVGAPPATRPSLRQSGPGVVSDKMFIFSVKVPEGNWRVTVTLGDANAESTTTVKAEARRLMLERIHTDAGQFVTRTFVVNVRGPQISTGGAVKLDPREPGSFTWDDKLSLQFSDTHPSLDSLDIEPAPDAVTVFLTGDSTVTDQPREPYGTWGQMLPRWFDSHVAIANHAESGETLKAFGYENRWAKVMSLVKPGDYVFMQFGHNDLNKTGHNAMWPGADGDWSRSYSPAETDYKQLLEKYAAEVKQKGATPVIVSPMTKINIRTGELNIAGLGDYPKAAVEAAKEAGVACIDLNAMSIELVKALGPDAAKKAYVEGLHSQSYGGYLFSRCIVEGIRQNHLDLANFLADDAGSFDISHPLPLLADFKLPLEPSPSFGRRGRPSTVPARGN
ncbi:MAG: rhamnogalacturonan acetylesterase [Tepidisphaeraceae bacterium]